MRILITGATGFVGSWLAEELAAAYPDATLFGTTTSETVSSLPALHLLPCDLTDYNAVVRTVAEAQPTHVFHLAGFASGAGGDADFIRRVNVSATRDLVQILHDAGRPCRVHLASSGYVYGATVPDRPAVETDNPHPSGAYAESKAEMEADIASFAKQDTPLSLLLTRAFNHTGARQTDAFVVPAFAKQIARIEKGLEPPTVRVGNLEAKRDFLSVHDVVRAYRLLLCERDTLPRYQIVNVASGIGVTIQSLLDTLLADATIPLTVEHDPNRMRPSDLPESVGSPALLTTLTGWHPQITLPETLHETLNYWRTTESS